MPELPEVEIVRESLNRKIKGKYIKKVLIKNRNLRFKIPFNFEKKLEGKKVKSVKRISKYLFIIFDNESACVIHLGMSGTIHLLRKNGKNNITNTSFYQSPRLPSKHNHVFINFKDIDIIYNDPRRFGYFKYFKDIKSLKKYFIRLGPEPFSKLFNILYLKENLKNKEKNIKNFLLDQNFVSGIGNIYANEILYKCKIRPDKKAKYLNYDNYKKIIYFSKKVLNNAIKKGGSSIRDFKNLSGKKGSFQNNFKVYSRENLNCLTPKCKGRIIKKNISNRSSFFCYLCQK